MKFYGDYVLYPVIGLLLLATLTFTIITHSHTGRIYPLEVETLAIPADPVTVEQGRQLVEAYHCAECHGADLAGKRISEDLRMGKISASNLTGGKGGVQSLNSDTDWVRAIRHGIHRSGRPLLLMPSDQYFELGNEDLAAMIAYLKQLPAVDNELPENSVGPLAQAMYSLGKLDQLIPAEKIPQGIKNR